MALHHGPDCTRVPFSHKAPDEQPFFKGVLLFETAGTLLVLLLTMFLARGCDGLCPGSSCNNPPAAFPPCPRMPILASASAQVVSVAQNGGVRDWGAATEAHVCYILCAVLLHEHLLLVRDPLRDLFGDVRAAVDFVHHRCFRSVCARVFVCFRIVFIRLPQPSHI